MGFKVLNINQLLDDIRFVDVKGNTWRLASTKGGAKFRDLDSNHIEAYIVRNDKEFYSGSDYHYIAGLIISFENQSIEATIHAIGSGWTPMGPFTKIISPEDFRIILYSRKNFIEWVETQLLGAYQNHFSAELLK
jgi:uncharacterized protein YbdZ (MbtH family)